MYSTPDLKVIMFIIGNGGFGEPKDILVQRDRHLLRDTFALLWNGDGSVFDLAPNFLNTRQAKSQDVIRQNLYISIHILKWGSGKFLSFRRFLSTLFPNDQIEALGANAHLAKLYLQIGRFFAQKLPHQDKQAAPNRLDGLLHDINQKTRLVDHLFVHDVEFIALRVGNSLKN